MTRRLRSGDVARRTTKEVRELWPRRLWKGKHGSCRPGGRWKGGREPWQRKTVEGEGIPTPRGEGDPPARPLPAFRASADSEQQRRVADERAEIPITAISRPLRLAGQRSRGLVGAHANSATAARTSDTIMLDPIGRTKKGARESASR